VYANNVNNVNDENKLLNIEFSNRQNLNLNSSNLNLNLNLNRSNVNVNVNGENKSPLALALDLQTLQERARKIKEIQMKMNSKFPSNNFKELDNNDTKQTQTESEIYKEETQNRKLKFLNLISRKIYFYKY